MTMKDGQRGGAGYDPDTHRAGIDWNSDERIDAGDNAFTTYHMTRDQWDTSSSDDEFHYNPGNPFVNFFFDHPILSVFLVLWAIAIILCISCYLP